MEFNILKGGSHDLRHVSRTHMVALDSLFDRCNLDSEIQIRYIDTKHQLADMLTKGNFTRDESNNLLHLFNISHFSSLCYTQNFSSISCPKTMAKRIQEEKEDRIVAESKPTAMNPTSTVSTSSSSVNHPIASKSPGILTRGQEELQTRRRVEFSRKAERCCGLMAEVAVKLAATSKSQESCGFSESESWSNHEKEVTVKLVASISSANSENSTAGSRKWPHNFHVSSSCTSHGEVLLDRTTYLRPKSNG